MAKLELNYEINYGAQRKLSGDCHASIPPFDSKGVEGTAESTSRIPPLQILAHCQTEYHAQQVAPLHAYKHPVS